MVNRVGMAIIHPIILLTTAQVDLLLLYTTLWNLYEGIFMPKVHLSEWLRFSLLLLFSKDLWTSMALLNIDFFKHFFALHTDGRFENYGLMIDDYVFIYLN